MYHKDDNVHNMAYSLTTFAIIGCFFLILASIVWWSIKNGISPMPTSKKAKKAIVSLIPREIPGKIYELGSGWGTLIIPLAKSFENSTIIGYETSPIPYFISKVRVRNSGLKNIQLFRKDFYDTSIADATIVVCYLFPGAMGKLKRKFENELKPGTLVISNTFAVPGWDPFQVFNTQDLYNTKVYLYKL